MSAHVVTKVPGRAGIELPSFYENLEWYYPNCELQTKEWFVKNAQPDWVYIDCGANIGYYSILFSQLSPAGFVHAIEPTETADMLARNVTHNHATNVAIHRVAVGEVSGMQRDRVYRMWGGPPEEREYEFTTLDKLVADKDIRRLDCIKIDVDSFDFEVLKGGEGTLERFDPWIVIELSNSLALRDSSTLEVLSWLRQRGYRTARVLDREMYVFRRNIVDGRPDDMPIEVISWLVERDVLPEVVRSVRRLSSEVPWVNEDFAAECLVSSARSARLLAEFRTWNSPSQAYPQWQCFQYAAFANAFAADRVLQVGRWDGEYTFSLISGMNCAPNRDESRLWSFCQSSTWKRGHEYQRVEELLGVDWLGRAELVTRLPDLSDLEAIVAPARRVLVFWNEQSGEAGDIILGSLLPLIREKEHAVIVHGISDGRFGTIPGYEGDGANMMILGDTGDIWSRRVDLPRILDFIARNGLQLLSPERAFRRRIETDIKLVRELEETLGPLFSTTAGWHWFSLNGQAAPIFYPKVGHIAAQQ